MPVRESVHCLVALGSCLYTLIRTVAVSKVDPSTAVYLSWSMFGPHAMTLLPVQP